MFPRVNLGFYRELTEDLARPSRGGPRSNSPTGVFPRSFPDHGSDRARGLQGVMEYWWRALGCRQCWLYCPKGGHRRAAHNSRVCGVIQAVANAQRHHTPEGWDIRWFPRLVQRFRRSIGRFGSARSHSPLCGRGMGRSVAQFPERHTEGCPHQGLLVQPVARHSEEALGATREP